MIAACLLLVWPSPARSIDAAALAPDLDRDGCPELALWCGNEELFVFPRSRAARLAPLPREPARSSKFLRVGDCDGDGSEDWLYADPEAQTSRGLVHVLSGATGRTIEILAGETSWNRLGAACVPLGDIDHDGGADFAVGAPGGNDILDSRPGVAHDVRSGSGCVRFVSGRLARELCVAWGSDVLGRNAHGFGGAMAAGLDFDHDGAPDLLVSADGYGADLGQASPPVALLSGVEARVLRTYTLPPIHAASVSMDLPLTSSLAALPDLDADGVPEVLVGASEAWYSIELDSMRHTPDRGRAWLLSGKDGRCLQTWLGDHAGEELGRWVFAAGDVDADSVSDFWILSRGGRTSDCPAVLRIVSGKTLVQIWSVDLDELLRLARVGR